MKATNAFILPITLVGLVACNVGSNHRQDETDGIQNLYDNRPQNGRIADVGEVDWYRFEPTQANSQIAVEVLSDTVRSDVELLVTLYQKNANGEQERLYADHAPEGALNGAEVQLNYQLASSEPVLISVRDLMDDEAANGDYRITAQEGMNDQGNDVLAGAVSLPVDGACISDRVDSMGDVDLFRFTLTNAQVTHIATTLNAQSDSALNLNLSLYGEDTLLIDNWSTSTNGVYSLRTYLAAGQYTLAIEDFGRDDFDLSAPFQTCVTTVANQEALENDTAATADVYDLTASSSLVEGSIGHQTDADWYALTIPTPGLDELQLLEMTLGANNTSEDLQYEVFDANGDSIFSYIHKAGSGSYSQQLLLGTGNHTMSVSLAAGERLQDAASYSVALEVGAVNDAAETGASNNTIATATELADATPATGKIVYRGDVDWYELEVTPIADTYQVLELSLTSSDESSVAYRMQVLLDEMIHAVDDPISSDNVLNLKTALLVPPVNAADLDGVRRYFVKVSDAYAEKSDAFATYTLTRTLRDLHSFDAANLPASVGATPYVLFNEAYEQQRLVNETNLVELELNGYFNETFAAEGSTLTFVDPQTAAATSVRSDNGDGTFSIDLPWLAGYIDFSGDQDWFAINLNDLGYVVNDGSGPTTVYTDADGDWHYVVQIDLVNNAGEPSEYQWRMYRDQGQNAVVRDRPTENGDGYFAQQGDATLSNEAVSLTTAGLVDDDDKPAFWVSDDWDETFYIGVSDFDFRRDPTNGSVNPVSDADWSNAATPYFIRVTLTYVPGEHRP